MAENNTLTSNLLLQRWTKFHLSCCQKCCLQLKKPSVSAGNKNCSLTWRVQHRVCIEPCGLNTQDWFVTKRQINIYTQTQTHEQKYYNVQTQTVDWRCLVARMPLIGSCWEFELPLALFSHQCKSTMTPSPFLSFSNVLVETQNQNYDFSNVWMHMSNPTTKFLHKIEWPNHMNSWESGLAFSLSFCLVSLQTIGDSSWQKHFSFFLFISQSLPFFGSLLLVLWVPPQIAVDCRRVNDFCTRHDWDVTTGGDAVLLKANSLLCSHSHRPPVLYLYFTTSSSAEKCRQYMFQSLWLTK